MWRLSLVHHGQRGMKGALKYSVLRLALCFTLVCFLLVVRSYFILPSWSLLKGSEIERDSWVSELRQAKAQLLASLNVINPNSTLTSSSSTNHLRRSLQALPFLPSNERIAIVRAVQSFKNITEFDPLKHDKDHRKGKEPLERRRKVEHWVPAIWVPDEKSDLCMRCRKPFNWRRRRHHCRLCGRCVCATCSGRVCHALRTVDLGYPHQIYYRPSSLQIPMPRKCLQNQHVLVKLATKLYSHFWIRQRTEKASPTPCFHPSFHRVSGLLV